MNVLYGNVECDGLKSKNWKRMHGIPMKAKAITSDGTEIRWLHLKNLKRAYVSKRSKKKKKKAQFRNINAFVKVIHGDKSKNRIRYRYGYMKKKYRNKLSRKMHCRETNY